jgi:hypothetical protein
VGNVAEARVLETALCEVALRHGDDFGARSEPVASPAHGPGGVGVRMHGDGYSTVAQVE